MNPCIDAEAEFLAQIVQVTAEICEQTLGAELADKLNEKFPASGEWYRRTVQLCEAGVEHGWLCGRRTGGIGFGRAAPASDMTHGFSIDVVEMANVVGPHHVHPNGEIDLVMPLEGAALFDGAGAGWMVYEPGSAHSPTVTEGRALILYLLPDGAIEFTR